MTPEERQAMEQRALDEERRKEAIREKEPAWNLYCVLDERLNKEFGTEGYLSKIVSDSYENDAAGDDKDRWASLQENFELKQQLDVLEEFDGLNDEEACGLVLCVKLPLLSRGHAIQVHTLSKEFVQVSVTNLYHLALALPFKVEGAVSFFDCKIRRLFIHVTK